MSSSLPKCVDLYGVDIIEGSRLTVAAAAYEKKEYTKLEAATTAVEEALKAKKAERKAIIAQIREVVPDFEVEKAEVTPEKVEPRIPEYKIEKYEGTQVGYGKPGRRGDMDRTRKVKGYLVTEPDGNERFFNTKKEVTEQEALVKKKTHPDKTGKQKLAALDKVSRQESSQFKQDSLFEPNQQGLFDGVSEQQMGLFKEAEDEATSKIPRKRRAVNYSATGTKPVLPKVATERIGDYISDREHIYSSEDAAAFGELNLSMQPQERFVVILLDKERKILGAHRSSIGKATSADVEVPSVTGSVLNMPEVKRIYLVHNHPSGRARLSTADMNLFRKFESLFEGTGVEVKDIIAIGKDNYGTIETGQRNEHALPEPRGTVGYKIPKLTRVFKSRGENLEKITSSIDVRNIASRLIPRGGILYLNGANAVVGYRSMQNYARMRASKSKAILRGVERGNAVALVAYNPTLDLFNTSSGRNLRRFVTAASLSVMDIIDKNDSWQDNGLEIEEGQVKGLEGEFFSTQGTTKPQDTITRKDLRAIFADMKNVRTGQDKDGNFWFKVKGRPKVTIFEVDWIGGYVKTSSGQIPVGSYQKDVIELKTEGMGSTADEQTAWHEFNHFIEESSIISDNDIQAISKATSEKLGININDVTSHQRGDYIGEVLSEWRSQKNRRIKRILKKIVDFMTAVYEMVSRTRTARGVLSDIESGRILKEKKESLVGINQFAQDTSFSIKEMVNGLAEEAKKYKNAEEFIEDLVFHGGSDKKIPNKLTSTGLSTSTDINVAKQYVHKKDAEVRVLRIKDSARILDSRKYQSDKTFDLYEKIREYARKKGADVVDYTRDPRFVPEVGLNENEMLILNSSVIEEFGNIKNKKQLIDIYKQAAKKPRHEGRPQEEIIKAITLSDSYKRWVNEESDYPSAAFGMRATRENVDVGDSLPVSYDLSFEGWEDMTKDELEPYKLEGTSAIQINHKAFKENPQEEISRVASKIKEYGNDIIIISGEDWGHLDASDVGEVIIKDAEVIYKAGTSVAEKDIMFQMAGKKAEEPPTKPIPSYKEALRKYQEEQAKPPKKSTPAFSKFVSQVLPGFKGNKQKLKYGYDHSRRDEEAFELSETSTLFETFKYNIVNWLDPQKKIQEAIEAATGTIPEYADVLTTEMLRISKTKADRNKAERHHYKPIKKMIGIGKLTVDTVDEFLYGRHAQEANARLRLTNARQQLKRLNDLRDDNKLLLQIEAIDSSFEKNPFSVRQEQYYDLLENELQYTKNEKEIKFKEKWELFKSKPSGMTDGEAKGIVKKYKNHKALHRIAEKFDAMNAEKLDILFESGRLSQEEYDAIKGTFKYYAPLKREGFESKPKLGKGIQLLMRDIKVRGGSTKRAVNLLANAMADFDSALIKRRKSESARALLELVKLNPNENVWRIETPRKTPGYDTHGNIVLYNDMSVQDNELKIKVDGKLYLISANNEHSFRVIKGLKGDNYQSGPIVNALGKLNRYLAMINTSLSPEFMINNFARDTQTAFYNLANTEIDHIKTRVMKDIPKAMKGLKNYLRGDGTHEWAKHAKQFEESGARIGWLDFAGTMDERARKLEKEIDLFRDGHVTRKSIHKLGKFIEDYNMVVENAVRLSTFKNAVEQGVPVRKAALMAKDLTVNFNQKGIYGTLFNSLYLFSNAGIQGSAKVLSVLKNSPKARKMVYTSMVAATALAIANSGMGGDDDDGVPYYDKIEDFVKERSMIIMIPGSKGKYIKIPLPWGYNVFWGLGTEVGDMITQKDYTVTGGTSRMISTITGAFNPLQSSTLLQMLSPTVTDPFVQVAENKTWSGNPLMPENSPFADVEKPDSELHWASARRPSILTARVLNRISGGNQIRPGLMDVSPETLDLVWDTFAGSAGKFAMDTLTLPVTLMEPDVRLKKVPIARRLVGQKSEYADSSKYRENIAHVYLLRDEIEAYPKRARDIRKDRTHSLLHSAKETEAKIRRQRKRLKTATTQEQKDRIKKRIQTDQQRFNKRFLDKQ